jgi:hypothetical protein
MSMQGSMPPGIMKAPSAPMSQQNQYSMHPGYSPMNPSNMAMGSSFSPLSFQQDQQPQYYEPMPRFDPDQFRIPAPFQPTGFQTNYFDTYQPSMKQPTYSAPQSNYSFPPAPGFQDFSSMDGKGGAAGAPKFYCNICAHNDLLVDQSNPAGVAQQPLSDPAMFPPAEDGVKKKEDIGKQ